MKYLISVQKVISAMSEVSQVETSSHVSTHSVALWNADTAVQGSQGATGWGRMATARLSGNA